MKYFYKVLNYGKVNNLNDYKETIWYQICSWKLILADMNMNNNKCQVLLSLQMTGFPSQVIIYKWPEN